MRKMLQAICILALVFAVMAPAMAETLIWDSGAPHKVVFSSTEPSDYSGFTTEGRWYAMAFSTGSVATINRVDVDLNRSVAENTTITYKVWERTALDAPGALVSSGTLGVTGNSTAINDLRVPDEEGTGMDSAGGNFLHRFTGLNIALDANHDYYFTIVGASWMMGGDQQPAELQQIAVWRSLDNGATWVHRDLGGLTMDPATGLGDACVYNMPFALYSNDVVPEPGSLLAMGTGLFGLLGFAIRRRK